MATTNKKNGAEKDELIRRMIIKMDGACGTTGGEEKYIKGIDEKA
jgi:hypothetical protein